MSSPNIVTSKSNKRQRLLKTIVDGLSHSTLQRQDFSSATEKEIKGQMYPVLVDQLEHWYREERDYKTEDLYEKKALESILFEGDEETTVNNFTVLGAQHRPDFIVRVNDLRIAVEVKSGHAGHEVRSGIGQAVTYAMQFDFVVYVFLDTSKGKNVKDSVDGSDNTNAKENFLIDSLWENYNIRFKVI